MGRTARSGTPIWLSVLPATLCAFIFAGFVLQMVFFVEMAQRTPGDFGASQQKAHAPRERHDSALTKALHALSQRRAAAARGAANETAPVQRKSAATFDEAAAVGAWDGGAREDADARGDGGARAGEPHRLAVVIPYYGPELPPWFRVFAASCGASAEAVDVLLFLQDAAAVPTDAAAFLADPQKHARPAWLAQNVHFHVLGTPRFARMHALARFAGDAPQKDLDDSAAGLPLEPNSLPDLVAQTFARTPRQLVEFKPAIGIIFAEYLRNYTHWAFGDLDLLLGAVPELVADDEWRDFDVVTYSFGDQWRAYARGQWTMHRNVESVNTAYASCDYLTVKLVTRLMARAHYESSEGCYSWALKNAGLSVKYVVRALTDADADAAREAWVVDGQVRACHRAEERLESKYTCRPLAPSAPGTFRRMAEARERRASLKGRTLENLRVSSAEHAEPGAKRCMSWVNPKFELCIQGTYKMGSDDTVFLRNGTFSALVKAQATADFARLDSGYALSAYFHFQEWKKKWRSWSAQMQPLPMNEARRVLEPLSLLVTKFGFLPLPALQLTELPPVPSEQEIAVALATDNFAKSLVYCGFKACGGRKAFVRDDLMVIVRFASSRATFGGRAAPDAADRNFRDLGVTLVVGGVTVRDIETFVNNACDWKGPVSAALFLRSNDVEEARDALVRLDNCRDPTKQPRLDGSSTLVVALLDASPADALLANPAKALLNVALDASRTRFTLALRSGKDVVGGGSYGAILDVLGGVHDTAPRGTTLVIPAFSFKGARPGAPDVHDVLLAREDGVLVAARGCTAEPALPDEAYDTWLKATTAVLDAPDDAQTKHACQPRHLDDALTQRDAAPTLVLDALDERGDRRLVRELDELAGDGCYDAAFVRSLLMHHARTTEPLLVPRAFVVAWAGGGNASALCGCGWHARVPEAPPSSQDAKDARVQREAIAGYAQYLLRADALRNDVDAEQAHRFAEFQAARRAARGPSLEGALAKVGGKASKSGGGKKKKKGTPRLRRPGAP